MNTAPFRDLGNITDSGNDKKWDYHEQMAKYQMDDSEISQKKEMTRLLMNAMDDYNAGKVAPDTIGADYFFLNQFMTYEMEYDFVAIEMDFLEHCRERLDEFNKVGWYGDEEHINYGPGLSVKKRIMRLIYNGAKLRDEDCLALIKYLYKLYHKKEYNRIKRFSRISAREILDVVNDNEDGSLDSAIGRVLGMCHFMNIKENEMKDALVEKQIVIIGGHVTWVNKLKKLFPEWKYIDTNAYKTVDGKMLDGKDMVYFFTDYMNHISYTKFIAAVRELKIPFGYLAGTNIENTVRQIYDSAL